MHLSLWTFNFLPAPAYPKRQRFIYPPAPPISYSLLVCAFVQKIYNLISNKIRNKHKDLTFPLGFYRNPLSEKCNQRISKKNYDRRIMQMCADGKNGVRNGMHRRTQFGIYLTLFSCTLYFVSIIQSQMMCKFHSGSDNLNHFFFIFIFILFFFCIHLMQVFSPLTKFTLFVKVTNSEQFFFFYFSPLQRSFPDFSFYFYCFQTRFFFFLCSRHIWTGVRNVCAK